MARLTQFWAVSLALASSYLLGSIPFPLLIVRWVKGIDVRAQGSGNMGAMNTRRVLGLGWAAVVFVLDAAKGAAAAWLGLTLGAGTAGPWVTGPAGAWVTGAAGPWQWGWSVPAAALGGALWCGAAAAAGHVWPVFAGFRGGKALAASFGTLMVVSPAMVVALGAWFAFLLCFAVRAVGVPRPRRMGVSGTLVALAAVPLAGWAWQDAAAALALVPWAAVVAYPHLMEALGRRGRGAVPPPAMGG